MNLEDEAEKIALAISKEWQMCLPRTVDNAKNAIAAFAKAVRTEAFEECAKIAESWRCQDGEADPCYPCDCGGEIPQEAIPKAIRARATAERGEGRK
jgi:hypothetical protein